MSYLDIEDREIDYNFIQSETFRAELGIRSIGLIYDDHSDDVNSHENVFRLKDNIEYKLFSATHQYLVFLRELGLAERYLQNIYKENPRFIDPNTFPMGNPYFDKVERELSSIFDSIVFHLSSVFDYLSHAVCYMYFTNKQDTLYWTKLSKKVRGDFKNKFKFCSALDQIDRRFVGHLYDYRSRLLHNKRDKHKFAGSVQLDDFKFRLKIACSEVSLKHFVHVNGITQIDETVTLTYLASWLIKQSFIEIENLLDAIKTDLETNSHFHKNLAHPKNSTGFMIVSMNADTNFVEPMSNGFWKQYKESNGFPVKKDN